MAKRVYIKINDEIGVKRAKKLWVNTGNGVKKVKKAWVCVSTDPLQVKLVYVAGYKYDVRMSVGEVEYIKNQQYAGSVTKPGAPTENGTVPSFSYSNRYANQILNQSFYLKESIGTNVLRSIIITSASKKVYYSSDEGSQSSYEDVSSSYGGPGGYETEPPFNSSAGEYDTANLKTYSWSWSSVLSHPTMYFVESNKTRMIKRTYTSVEPDKEVPDSPGGYEEEIGSEFIHKYVADPEDGGDDYQFDLSGYLNCTKTSTGYTLSNPTRVHFYSSGPSHQGIGSYVYWVGQEYEDLPSTMTTNSYTKYWGGSALSPGDRGFYLYGQNYEITYNPPTYKYVDRYHYTKHTYEAKSYPYELQHYEEKIIEGE